MNDIDKKFFEQNKDRIVLHNPENDLLEIRRDAVHSNNIHSDLWILRQRERLESLGDSVVDILRERFSANPQNNPFAGLSDDELFDTIKPRGIQTAAELKNYILVMEKTKGDLMAKVEVSKDTNLDPNDTVKESAE